MSDFPKLTIEELLSRKEITIKNNFRAPLSKMQRLNMQAGELFPYYGAAGIIDFVNDWKFDKPSLLIAEDGTVFSKEPYPMITKASGKFWVSNHAHVIQGPNIDFLFYSLGTTDIYEFITGGVQPKLTKGNLLKIAVTWPDKVIRDQILSILTSIDDKIDLLNRQNETLEAMAQTLFRQWFIEEADDGWEEVDLGELVSLPGGFSFKSNSYRQDGAFKVVTIKAIQDGKFVTENAEKVHELPAKLKEHQCLQIGDALISLTGNVGRVCLVDEQKCLLNQRVSKIVGKSYLYTMWGYYYFRQPHMIEKLTHLSKGTAQLNLSPLETLKETIRIPKHERFVDFFNTIIPNHEKLISNKVQVRSLNRMRDTLLPKLMSGEVRVKLD